MTEPFPDFIAALPRPDSPLAINARIVPSDHALTMFYEVDEELSVPEHAHGAQWGVVLDGSMLMTIGSDSRVYRRGDTYFVPAGVTHRTVIYPGYRGIDVFADAHRYTPRSREPRQHVMDQADQTARAKHGEVPGA
jgi:quercetin dioxygenase-like cupin family protein